MLSRFVFSAVLLFTLSAGIFGQTPDDRFLNTQFKLRFNGDALCGVRIDGKPNTFGLPSIKEFLKKFDKSKKYGIDYAVTYVNTGCTTIYDICSNGSAVEIWQDPATPDYIHAVFMTAPLGDGTSFPNRRSKNYFSSDKGNTWQFITDVPYGVRSGFPVITGCSDGTALIANHSTDGGGILRSQAYKDVFPGVGSYTRLDAPGNNGYEWPVLITTANLSHANKFLMFSSLKDYDTTRFNICTNTNMTPGTWLGWNTIQSEQSGAFALARNSDGRIGIAYINDNNRYPSTFGDLWFMESTNDGISFSTPLKIFDAKFGYTDDTLGAFKGISIVYAYNSPCVVFETVKQNDITSSFYPDAPAEIRFWSSILPGSNPDKSIIIADTTNVGFHPYIGVNDGIASICRPSIGTSFDENKLYVAFSVSSGLAGGSVDSTSYMDLWFTHSNTNGLTWAPPSKINPPTPVKDWRYPSVSPKSDNSGSNYYCNLVVLKGSIPGSYINGNNNGESAEQLWFLRINIEGTPSVPQPPTLLSPANNSTGVSTTPLFDWSNVTGAASYNIQISTNSSFTSPIVYLTGLTNSEFQPGSGLLQMNATYYWRVSSTNYVGTSSWSDTWSFTTSNLPPAPVLVSPANGSTIYTYTPLLDWNDVSTATTYSVQISTDSNFTAPLLNIGTPVSQFTVPSGLLSANVYYFWRARGESGAGNGPWSVKWKFRISPTGICQTTLKIPNEFRLHDNYPNPFNPETTINFDIPNNSHVSISIYDISGKKIEALADENLQAGTYRIKWNGSNYASGVYFVQLNMNNDKLAVKKLILTK